MKQIKLCSLDRNRTPARTEQFKIIFYHIGTFGRVYLELRKLLYYPRPTGVSRAGIVLRGQYFPKKSSTGCGFKIFFSSDCFAPACKFFKITNRKWNEWP